MTEACLPEFPCIEGVEFRMIPGWPKYAASSDGFVWNCFRGQWRRKKGSSTSKEKRFHVTLFRDGKPVTKSVPRLIALAFLGLPPQGALVCHCDGNPQNDSVENLRYDTAVGNALDMKDHGTVLVGERNVNAKLTWEVVDQIRGEYKKGEKGFGVGVLAKKFSMSQSVVSAIVRGRIWKRPEHATIPTRNQIERSKKLTGTSEG